MSSHIGFAYQYLIARGKELVVNNSTFKLTTCPTSNGQWRTGWLVQGWEPDSRNFLFCRICYSHIQSSPYSCPTKEDHPVFLTTFVTVWSQRCTHHRSSKIKGASDTNGLTKTLDVSRDGHAFSPLGGKRGKTKQSNWVLSHIFLSNRYSVSKQKSEGKVWRERKYD